MPRTMHRNDERGLRAKHEPRNLMSVCPARGMDKWSAEYSLIGDRVVGTLYYDGRMRKDFDVKLRKGTRRFTVGIGSNNLDATFVVSDTAEN